MKRMLAMLLSALMVLSLLPAQTFADETVPVETVTVVEEAPEQTVAETAAEVTEEEPSTEEPAETIVEETAATAEILVEETMAATEETVEEETAAATEETAAEETMTVTDEAVNEAAEDIPDPVLTYWFLWNHNDEWTQQDWDMSWNNGKYGWEHTTQAPGENWMIFYLNTWNTETESWDYAPVHVNFGEHLSGQLLADGDYDFAADAEDTGYYYRVSISESGWDQSTVITYEYEGETLEIGMDIKRYEDGWYTSTTMSNDTYICQNYRYSQISPENNVFYFGFDSDWWTIVGDVDISVENVPINGYNAADAITVTKLNSNQYKIALDPFPVAANVNFEVIAKLTVKDPDGHTEEWEPRIWVESRHQEGKFAGMEINHTWIRFEEEDGVTKAMEHTPTDYTYAWGDQVFVYEPVELPAGVSYDLSTNTLTLNKAKLDSLKVFYSWYNEENGESGSNLPNENLTIKLVGTSTIQGQEDLLGFGDDVKATFTGTGTLNLNSKCTDPNAWPVVLNTHNGAEVTLNGPTVNVNGEVTFEAQDGWPIALNVDRGCHLIVNKGKLNVNAKNYNSAVMLNGDYTQNGGEVTVISDNEYAGFFYDEQERLNNFQVFAMSSKGYTTINGGKLTLDGYTALEVSYDSGDPNNPDWGPQPNVKFTLNDGTVEAKGDFRGIMVLAPMELKGGSLNASTAGLVNPMADMRVGQAMGVWHNGTEEVTAYVEITGGNHTFTGATGEKCGTYGIVASDADVFFKGGTSTMRAVYAIIGQNTFADNKLSLEVAKDMHVYDLKAEKLKEIQTGEFLLQEENLTFYINGIMTDDDLDPQLWWNGEDDDCTDVMITVHLEETIPGKAATCTKPGLTDGKKCTICGETTVEQETIKAKGHTYADDKTARCDVCGLMRSVPMFRMYDPNSGEHFYTGSEVERDFLVSAGWHYEGVGFNFPFEGRPVHRLYDPVHGEHLYTMDEAEMNKLISWGWSYEGVAFNSAGNDEVPQYRLHNPNAKRGGYHFTGSEEERDLLISFGWISQGIGWYSCKE